MGLIDIGRDGLRLMRRHGRWRLRPPPVPVREVEEPPARWFEGICHVCGVRGRFTRDRMAIGASYPCTSCGSSLRYQGQARVLVRHLSRHAAASFVELCDEPEFQQLRIWEPGELGPFRAHLRRLPWYQTSSYWPDVTPGDQRDGVRCENLMALTYPSASFDLVITSDVFEHVRRPYIGFAEVHRVLRPGGAHVFTVPVRWPMRKETIVRVDTSGDEDLFLTEPTYHRHHLVYNDFGEDMLDHLATIGFDTEVVRFDSQDKGASKLLTFCSVRREAASQ